MADSDSKNVAGDAKGDGRSPFDKNKNPMAAPLKIPDGSMVITLRDGTQTTLNELYKKTYKVGSTFDDFMRSLNEFKKMRDQAAEFRDKENEKKWGQYYDANLPHVFATMQKLFSENNVASAPKPVGGDSGSEIKSVHWLPVAPPLERQR